MPNTASKFRTKREAIAFLTTHETYDGMYTVNISMDRLTVPDTHREAFDWLFSRDDGMQALWDLRLRDVLSEWEATHQPHEVFTEGRSGKHLCLSGSTLTPYVDVPEADLRETPAAIAIRDANLLAEFDALAVTMGEETLALADDLYQQHVEAVEEAKHHNTTGSLQWCVLVGDVPIHYQPGEGQYVGVDDLEVRRGFTTKEAAQEYAMTVERYTVLVLPLINADEVLSP